MDLIVTDTNGTPSAAVASWTLDLAYGSGRTTSTSDARHVCSPDAGGGSTGQAGAASSTT